MSQRVTKQAAAMGADIGDQPLGFTIVVIKAQISAAGDECPCITENGAGQYSAVHSLNS